MWGFVQEGADYRVLTVWVSLILELVTEECYINNWIKYQNVLEL